MTLRFVKTSIDLPEVHVSGLDAICAARSTTRAAIIRDAIREFLDRQSGSSDILDALREFLDRQKVSSDIDKRTAMLGEFTQYAVDVLIRTQAPDTREDILSTVQDRMERYNA